MLLEGVETFVEFSTVVFLFLTGLMVSYLWFLIKSYSRSQLENTNHAETRTSDSSQCPICFSPLKYAVKTSCGHFFCGQCLKQWFDTQVHSNLSFVVTCPVCRSSITLLLQYFTQDEITDESTIKHSTMVFVREHNVRFSNHPVSVLGWMSDFVSIMCHGFWRIYEGDFTLLFRVRCLIMTVGAILYLLSPFDILPEAVFGVFGLFDDLLVIVLILMYIYHIFREDIA